MEDYNYSELLGLIEECLDSTFVGVLATVELEKAWATPIYFVYDNEFNFYFMSDRGTRHIKDIENNNRVSFAVFMPSKDSLGFKVGLQVEGTAVVVPDEQVEEVYKSRSMRLTGMKTWNKDSIGGHIVVREGGIFMKIKTQEMHYLDKRYLGGESRKISMPKLIGAKKARMTKDGQ